MSSVPMALSQPAVRVVQPSPGLPRRQTQPPRNPIQNIRPIPLNLPPSPTSNHENVNCPLCPIVVVDDAQAVMCDRCLTWYHASCLLMTDAEYQQTSQSDDDWYCDH